MKLKFFTRRRLKDEALITNYLGHLPFAVLLFTNVSFQRCTLQDDTQVVHTKGIKHVPHSLIESVYNKGISKIAPLQQIFWVIFEVD